MGVLHMIMVKVHACVGQYCLAREARHPADKVPAKTKECFCSSRLTFPSFVLQGQRGGGFRLSCPPFHREGPHPNPSRRQIQGGSASHILTLPAQPAHPGSQNRWLRAAPDSAKDTGHAVRVWRDSEAVDAIYSDACFCGVCIGRASREVPEGDSWLELAARQPW